MDSIERFKNTIEVQAGVIYSLQCRLNSVSAMRKWTGEWKLLSRKLKRLENADAESGVMQRRVAKLELGYSQLLKEFETLVAPATSKRNRMSTEKKERLALEASLRCSEKEKAALGMRLQLQERRIEEMELKVDEYRHGMRMCMKAAKKSK